MHPGGKKRSLSHEELFIERYDLLRDVAMNLTGFNHQLTRDLLADTFIAFAKAQPDLNKIHDLSSYLGGTLFNLKFVWHRDSIKRKSRQLKIQEYAFDIASSRAVDSRELIRIQDALRQIFQLACSRKETTKLASVLILRFFYGYYPAEIARVLRVTRASIDSWLRHARDEMKCVVAEMLNRLEYAPCALALSVQEFLGELREMILRSRTGECLSELEVKRFYGREQTRSLSSEQLSHIVSCEHCLDAINEVLQFPLLAQRDENDALGRSSRIRDR